MIQRKVVAQPVICSGHWQQVTKVVGPALRDRLNVMQLHGKAIDADWRSTASHAAQVLSAVRPRVFLSLLHPVLRTDTIVKVGPRVCSAFWFFA
jgi:hypothetical protein